MNPRKSNRRGPDGKLTITYRKWSSMIQRCNNPKHLAYKHYGGKGIKVCGRWTFSFDRFFEDMGEAPAGHWIDRIDNALGYQPGNCRWVTAKQSAANRSRVGPKPNPDTLRQKAIRAGLDYHFVYQRVKIQGWTEEEALTTPKLPRNWNNLEFRSKSPPERFDRP